MACRRMAIAILLLLLVACSQSSRPLQVTALYPQDGYHGFKKDEAIVIEFNRPVDPASFADAYRSNSEGLKPDQVTVTWSDGDTKVTVKPKQPLAYSPDDNYIYYSFEVGTELVDRNGDHLAEPLRVSFSTLRTLTAAVKSAEKRDGIVLRTENNGNVQLAAFPGSTAIVVGDGNNDESSLGFVGFPWPQDLVELQTAGLRLYSPAKNGDPFANLGKLLFEAIDMGDGVSESDAVSAALPAAPVWEDGSHWTTGSFIRYDVTDLAQAARNEGLGWFDLRLRFESATNGDSAADAVMLYTQESISTGRINDPELLPTLELTYYGP